LRALALARGKGSIYIENENQALASCASFLALAATFRKESAKNGWRMSLGAFMLLAAWDFAGIRTRWFDH
jgi:hypothetical protein